MEKKCGFNWHTKALLYMFLRFPGGSISKESAQSAGDPGSIPGSGRYMEEGMATHSSVLAGRIPWTEQPGGLQYKKGRISQSF